jgi:hypothetical protein
MKTVSEMLSNNVIAIICNRGSAKKYNVLVITCVLLISISAYAGEADVINVDIKKTGDHTYFVKVTVRHADEGWDHYANKWDVVAPDGTILGTRTLYHPHVDEQPFTRSLSDVKIPAPITEVTVRAHDSVHEYGGKTMEVAVPK